MTEQHYGNHQRLVPGFHYLCGGLLLSCIVLAIIYLVKYGHAGGTILPGILLLLLPIIMGVLGFYSRYFALKAQDRAIRAEENLRHFVLTGQLLDPKLRMSQIIALRFANNEEFLELAKRAVAENMNNSAIKQAIQKWKPDHSRV
jgi:hypothetical protein